MSRRNARAATRWVPAVESIEERTLLAAAPWPLPGVPALFTEPQAGRGPVIAAIDAARHDIRLGICNISDEVVGNALIAAAQRGVNVRVIVDQADYHAKPVEQAEVQQLIAGGVSVHLSNPVFPQSFEKDLVIDQRFTEIMTMCLIPQSFEDTRDYGLVVTDPRVTREVTRVFENDWAYSAPPGVTPPPYNPTPALRVPKLIWGPPDSTSKLAALIQSAHRTLDVTTELLDDPFLEGQLIAAVNRGVKVRLMAPQLSRANTGNTPQLNFLKDHGVEVRVSYGRFPIDTVLPYIHAKTMVVDGRTSYLGSIDLQTQAATQSRELGIILHQPSIARQLIRQFNADWQQAILPLQPV